MTSEPRQIKDSGVSSAIVLWLFGIVFAAVPLLLFSSSAQHGTKAPPIWAVAVFGLVGLLMLCMAAYVSISAAKYGRSIFESPWLPAACGGALTGTIRITRPFTFHEPIHLRLDCVEHIRSGKNSREQILWSDQCTLDRLSPGAAVAEFPVYFKIPAGVRPMGYGRVTWRLQAKAKTTGVHYSSTFAIPVMLETPIDLPEFPDPTLALRSPEPVRRQPRDRHLHFNPLPGGGGKFELMPGRNLGAAIALMVFGAIFVGAGTAMEQFMSASKRPGQPTWFPFIFIGVGALVALIGVRLLLLKTTLEIRHGVLNRENTVAFLNRRREIRASDISDISVKLQGQLQNRPFYSINAMRPTGNPIQICGTIYDKTDADWMAAEIKRQIFEK